MDTKKTQTTSVTRPPIVVVMGHIDHGKSTLLDYIRKTNVVDGEAGGITQHLSAYVVSSKDSEGQERAITFLDTPGHEAFAGMRNRGAKTADVAILVVSAEDSVKAQTLEAYKTIEDCGLPYVVAINKIDKPNANPTKVRMDLAEKGIYLEGFGGSVSSAEISAKTGAGIENLLELILLTADIAELKGDPKAQAEGIVIESHLDPRRGMTATLIVLNGTLSQGMFVASGTAMAGTRIMEDFRLRPMKAASLSEPVGIVGWNEMPEVGSTWKSYASKRDAEKAVEESRIPKETTNVRYSAKDADVKHIPIIVRADTAGTTDAVLTEIKKLELPSTKWKILAAGVGNIGEADIKTAAIDPTTVIVGFNTKIDPRARELIEQTKANITLFDVIYKLSDYMKDIVEERRPPVETTVVGGIFKVQKTFGRTKDRQVAGGLVMKGEIAVGNEFRILRRDAEIGRGTIVHLEQNRNKTKNVAEGLQCGALLESRIEVAPGDMIEAITKVIE